MIHRPSSSRAIDAVAEILSESDRPMSAHEIVERAQSDSKYKEIITGNTPHKTVNARIAIDIKDGGSSSRFFRFASAVYGLRSHAEHGIYEPRYCAEYAAPSRRKAVAKEDVAVVAKEHLDFLSHDGMYDATHFPLHILTLLPIKYVRRREAEEREDVKQLVSYAYIKYVDDIIAYERGRYTSDGGEFLGQNSIGFGGHINIDDLSLFDKTTIGLYDNISRELHEELHFFRRKLDNIIDGVKFCGFLVDSSTANGRRHLGLAVEVTISRRLHLQNSGLGIRNLRWISTKSTPNVFHHFEIWSQYLFRHIQGRL